MVRALTMNCLRKTPSRGNLAPLRRARAGDMHPVSASAFGFVFTREGCRRSSIFALPSPPLLHIALPVFRTA